MEHNLSLEDALKAELQKDVKLKGGQVAVDEDGRPLKAFDAIAKSIMNNAMKGDIAAVNFIRNLTKQGDADADRQRVEEHRRRVQEACTKIINELKTEGLWLGQQVEVEQLAENWLIIDRLNEQMLHSDYRDIIQEMRKDGSVQIRINPIHEWRDKYQKQFLSDMAQLRDDAQSRTIMIEQNKQKQR